MKTRFAHIACALVALLAVGAFCARQSPPVDKDAFPGELRLLEGYEHAAGVGADTHVGRIFKEKGPTFRYDLGAMAGSRVDALRKDGYVWEREQVLAGRTVQMARHPHGHVIVSILQPESDTKDPQEFETQVQGVVSYPANFFGEVESEAQLAELLLMALSYQPKAVVR